MAALLRLIVNPVSGGGRAGRMLPEVVRYLQDRDIEFRTSFTRSLDHGTELAAAATLAGETAVAMGGDGVVSAVVNGLGVEEGGSKGLLGIIPAGRGNDFARWLGLNSTKSALAALGASAERQVDVGSVNGRFFTCIASFGFDSEVIETAERTSAVRGSLVYPYATVKALLGWRPANFEIDIDGQVKKSTGYSVVVANGGCYGGGMKIAPSASVDDGLFDVVTIGNVSKLRFLAQAPKVFRGTHVTNDEVTVEQGRVVSLKSDRPFTIFADGEPCGQAPATVTVRARALRVLAPSLVV